MNKIEIDKEQLVKLIGDLHGNISDARYIEEADKVAWICGSEELVVSTLEEFINTNSIVSLAELTNPTKAAVI